MRCSLKLLKTRAQALWHRGVASHRKLIRKLNSHWARISPVTFLNEPHVATAMHQGHKHLIAEWLKGGNGIHTAGMLDSVMSHANLKLQCISGALQSTWSTCWHAIYVYMEEFEHLGQKGQNLPGVFHCLRLLMRN